MTDERMLLKLAYQGATTASALEAATALAALPLVAASLLERKSGEPVRVIMVSGADDCAALEAAYADRGQAQALLTRLWQLQSEPAADEAQISAAWSAVERYFKQGTRL